MRVDWRRILGLAVVLVVAGSGGLWAEEKDPLKPRVPSGEREEAKKLESPIDVSDDVVAEGKEIYEGKGICANCHGKGGEGDGPAGKTLDPAPRDLTNCEFQDQRADGELFWVIKNGSPGTGMVSLVPGTINEEEAWKVIAYIRSLCSS
jgi:mono/diheme cytochrome c family protein